MDERHACIIGSGTMGKGIAQIFAQAKYKVTVITHTKESMKEARRDMKATFDKLVEDEKIERDYADNCLDNISFTQRYEAAEDASIVIEAVPEVPEIKRDVLGKITAVCPGDAVIASNTSSISITELAESCHNPERFIGMHFFNPVPVMNLVEVVMGEKTADETMRKALEVVQMLGKTPVTVKDSPGFVSNRLLMIYLNEAFHTYSDDIASKEDIDTVAKLGFNHPMGPLELADYIGLDVVLDIMEVLHEELGDKFEPADILTEKVEKGELGRKTGKGFYSY